MIPLAASEYFRQSNPVGMQIALLVLVVALIIYGVIRWAIGKAGGQGAPTGKKGATGQAASQGSRARVVSAVKPVTASTATASPALRRFGRELGLGAEHVALLSAYAVKFSLRSPEKTFADARALDNFLKQAFQDIESHAESEAAAEAKKTLLFQIREAVDGQRQNTKPLNTSRNFQANQAITFVTPKGEHFSSKILANEPGGLACVIPRDGLSQEMRFPRNTHLSCFLYANPQSGVSFETKILGYVERSPSAAMVLKHSDRVQALPTRRHKRRKTQDPCDFTPVTVAVEKRGSQTTRRVIPNGRALPGQVVDLSAGGLSLRSANPLDEGQYLKIDFAVTHGRLSAIGRVVKIGRLKSGGGVMHVQFVKITRKDINAILSYIYDYAE